MRRLATIFAVLALAVTVFPGHGHAAPRQPTTTHAHAHIYWHTAVADYWDSWCDKSDILGSFCAGFHVWDQFMYTGYMVDSSQNIEYGYVQGTGNWGGAAWSGPNSGVTSLTVTYKAEYHQNGREDFLELDYNYDICYLHTALYHDGSRIVMNASGIVNKYHYYGGQTWVWWC